MLTSGDLELEVRSSNSKLGELHISKGSVDWRPANSKGTEYRMTWEKFAAFMQENGRTSVSKRK
jgi:hypothetical protein